MGKDENEETAVIVVIEQYINSYINADLPALQDVFAPDAIMNGYVAGRLVEGTPEPFFQQVAANPPLKSSGHPLEYQIEHISVTGNAAAVLLREVGFGQFNFTDYMHLLKRNGEWKIISKTFTTF